MIAPPRFVIENDDLCVQALKLAHSYLPVCRTKIIINEIESSGRQLQVCLLDCGVRYVCMYGKDARVIVGGYSGNGWY